MEHISWYPGHMKKTRDLIRENMKMVDAAVELLDARIPQSGRNPVIDELISGKKRIIVLNKSDLSDEAINDEWLKFFKKQGIMAVCVNSLTGEGINELLKLFKKIHDEKNENQIRKRALRIMIVGIPNVGKSSLINRLTGRKSAKTGNKPGITRGKQWLNLKDGIQLLDTPGILWPKFEDPEVGLKLAFIGSIKDEILDSEAITLKLIEFLASEYPNLLKQRYKLEMLPEKPLDIMEAICRKRGFILSEGRTDYERAARTVMDEYRAGKIGRISLERPPIKSDLMQS